MLYYFKLHIMMIFENDNHYQIYLVKFIHHTGGECSKKWLQTEQVKVITIILLFYF